MQVFCLHIYPFIRPSMHPSIHPTSVQQCPLHFDSLIIDTRVSRTPWRWIHDREPSRSNTGEFFVIDYRRVETSFQRSPSINLHCSTTIASLRSIKKMTISSGNFCDNFLASTCLRTREREKLGEWINYLSDFQAATRNSPNTLLHSTSQK